MNFKTRLSSKALLALIVFQGFAWFMVWQMLYWQNKFIAQLVLPSESTAREEIVISRQDYDLHRIGSKEISWSGRMYDIRRSIQEADSVRLFVYQDQKEQTLLSLLGGTDSNSSTPPIVQWLLRLLGSPFLTPVRPDIQAPVDHNPPAVFAWDFPCSEGLFQQPFHPPRVV